MPTIYNKSLSPHEAHIKQIRRTVASIDALIASLRDYLRFGLPPASAEESGPKERPERPE